MRADNPGAYFELSFAPNTQLVPSVRRFVNDFYNHVIDDPDVTSCMALATHELLENAVRYSTDGATQLSVGVREGSGGVDVRIDTTNSADVGSIEVLKRALGALDSAESADAHYQALMRETAKHNAGSGLGLGRVGAEAMMHLSCEATGTRVRVSATGEFPKAKISRA